MPWLCAATVRSINHVKALHLYDSSSSSSSVNTVGGGLDSGVSGSGGGVGDGKQQQQQQLTLSTTTSAVVVGTVENRLSGFFIHAVIGIVVVWLRPLLRLVPTCVLSGLFLYLGQSALRGNQVTGDFWSAGDGGSISSSGSSGGCWQETISPFLPPPYRTPPPGDPLSSPLFFFSLPSPTQTKLIDVGARCGVAQ
jgi:hypothetical protein